MDSALHLQAAVRAYRTSFASLGVIIVFSAMLLMVSTGAGVAASLGGLVAWLPHVYMIGKVFGLSRHGVKAVNLGGLLAAEGVKFALTAGLFVIAFALVKADHAGHLLIGFIVAVLANLAASVGLVRQLGPVSTMFVGPVEPEKAPIKARGEKFGDYGVGKIDQAAFAQRKKRDRDGDNA